MRLSDAEVAAIKTGVASCFGDGSVARLYGSRLDDTRRGGDIDLHIEVADRIPDYRVQAAFLDAIDLPLDGRKVDLVFSVRGGECDAFERIAYRDGAVL